MFKYPKTHNDNCSRCIKLKTQNIKWSLSITKLSGQGTLMENTMKGCVVLLN